MRRLLKRQVKKIALLISVLLHVFSTCVIARGSEVFLKSRRSLRQVDSSEDIYVIKRRINLKGQSIVFPEGSIIRYDRGYFYNGTIVFNNNKLEGSILFRGHITGSIHNDTINVGWFKYKENVLADVFSISNDKVVQFPYEKTYDVDYELLIPSCTVIGNNCCLNINSKTSSSSISKCIKVRNKHFDGDGKNIDSFTFKNITLRTSVDETYLLSVQNARNITLRDCILECTGTFAKCMHVLDFRGNVQNVEISNCQLINRSSAKEGGGMWLRSFGHISNIRVINCEFYNNTIDESIALNAVEDIIEHVSVTGCKFVYEKGSVDIYPHVFWGMTKRYPYNSKSISFTNNHLYSDYLPSYIINTNGAEDVTLTRNSFIIKNFTMHNDGLTTTAFNGKMLLLDNDICIDGMVNISNPRSQINIFSSDVTVVGSTIINNCSSCHLGAPSIYSSKVFFNNSQLFNGNISKVMIGNYIFLGGGTPILATNPYAHHGKCVWKDNKIESEKEVEFNMSYDGIFIESSNNIINKIKIIGARL